MVPGARIRFLITVVTATGLETAAARKALPEEISVVQGGIALASSAARITGSAISCGLAGGLRTDLPTGTVLIPRSVRRPDGTLLACDADLTGALIAAAEILGYRACDAPLLTSATLVHGGERSKWAAQGFAGVDMETGLIEAERVACVRIVLDTPQREISPAWERPLSVLFQPRAWRDLPFLAREGPRCAQLAARIVATALR